MQKSFAIGIGALLGALFCFQPANASYLFPDVSSSVHKNHGHERAFAGHRPDSVTHGSGIQKGNDGCDHWIALGRGCGCTVARMLGIPVNYNGWNLRQAREWVRRFPRTSPHVGAVAFWTYPHEHVELVTAVHDGRFDSSGTYGFRNVPISHAAFVDPSARNAIWASNY